MSNLYGRGTIELKPAWPDLSPPYWEIRDAAGGVLATIMLTADGEPWHDTYAEALLALGLKRPHRASPVLAMLRDGWDDYDPWGSGMMALGDICDLMTAVGAGDIIPNVCGYSPGAFGAWSLDELTAAADEDDPLYGQVSSGLIDLAYAYAGHRFDDFDLERAARILHRYLDVVRAAGKDY